MTTYTYTSGSHYKGEMQDDCFKGHGVFSFHNGDIYKGDFSHDMFHGTGTYTFTSGSQYKGQFYNDKFHGIGVFTYYDGSSEKGKFNEDKRVGKFYHYDYETKAFYEIIYQNDKCIKCIEIEGSAIADDKKPL